MNFLPFLSSFGLIGAGGTGNGNAGDGNAGDGGQGTATGVPTIPAYAQNFPTELTGNEPGRNFLGLFKDDGAKVEVPVALVKSAIETKQMVGGMVKVPEDGAAPDKIAAFNKKIGVPDKAGDYEFKMPEGTPEGLFSDEDINAFRGDAHELGIPKAKAEKLFDRFATRQGEAFKGMAKASEETLQGNITKLKADLGADYDATVALADKAVNFADPGIVDVYKENGLLGNPALVKGWAKIGKAMGEDVLRGTGSAPVPSETLTVEQLDQMVADPKYRLPENDPVGKAWRAKVEAGYQKLYPGTSSADVNPSTGRAMHGRG